MGIRICEHKNLHCGHTSVEFCLCFYCQGSNRGRAYGTLSFFCESSEYKLKDNFPYNIDTFAIREVMEREKGINQ